MSNKIIPMRAHRRNHPQRTRATLTQADIKAIIRALQDEGLIPSRHELGAPVSSRPDLPLPF